MNKYRKKPVVIEAIQFTGRNQDEVIVSFDATTHIDVHFELHGGQLEPVLSIKTLEGTMTVSTNDWVIKGVQGEFYPCKPDIFEASYEPAEQEVTS